MEMLAHQSSSSGIFSCSSSSSCVPRLCGQGRIIMTRASLVNIPKNSMSLRRDISFTNLSTRGLVEELKSGTNNTIDFGSMIEKQAISINNNIREKDAVDSSDHSSLVLEKLYAILEAVADRVEMHKNVGEQRDRWNSLLLTSINTITLAAATLMSVDSSCSSPSSSSSLKVSSTLLYLAATGMLIIVNKIQPSQLAEEQRNAARLFKQLQNQIQRIITIGNPTERDVKESMDKVLALDKAYPLPLLGAMLDKFPSTVEPAVWWPSNNNKELHHQKKNKKDIWNGKLEEQMRKVVQVIRKKDKPEYLRLGEKALKLNKLLSITGPLLTGLAAVGSALACSSFCSSASSWAIVAGALASVVNTVEHGGQVGMVFEMYRNNAGFFKLMEESIESSLSERRENEELLEIKVALQLGRSLSELRELASNSSRTSSHEARHDDDDHEFASKLF